MPVTRTRAGFTLVELLIVMVLVGLVGMVLVRVLTDTQRITVAQGERAMMQSATRTGVLVVPAELREINAWMGDIIAMSDSSITYRGLRAMAVACGPTTTAGTLVETASIQGLGSFAVNDSVLVFVEGLDPLSVDDDTWALARISSVATAACPNTNPGTLLGFAGTMAVFDLATGTWQTSILPVFGDAAVIRKFEHTTLALYQDGEGVSWLGMQGPSDAGIQPVVGPLAADDGFTLAYLDVNGNPAGSPELVRSIDVKVVGVTSRQIREGNTPLAYKFDSLSTRVALRNSF
jgi:prepilin-type N-terminal cleavage/methylation domain-containing protein